MKKNRTRKQRIETKVRSKIVGKSDRIRLSVFKSSKYIYAQAIDDVNHTTVAAGWDKMISSKKEEKHTKSERARMLGVELAKKLLSLHVKEVVFDRGSFPYIGRVQALAEGLREGGIII